MGIQHYLIGVLRLKGKPYFKLFLPFFVISCHYPNQAATLAAAEFQNQRMVALVDPVKSRVKTTTSTNQTRCLSHRCQAESMSFKSASRTQRPRRTQWHGRPVAGISCPQTESQTGLIKNSGEFPLATFAPFA